LSDTVIEEREQLVGQLLHLGELDRRKLFFHYASLRAYLVAEHGMEEWVAERRIRAARLVRRFPQLVRGLESGKLNLSLLELAQGCAHREGLDDEEFLQLVDAISGQSCQRARREMAARYPQTSELPRDRVRPLTETHSEIRFVAPHELLDQLEEIRGLLAHSHPGITMAELVSVLAREYRERHHPEARARRAWERAERKKEAAFSPSDPVDSPTSTRVEPEAGARVGRTESREPRAFPDSIIYELIRLHGFRCSYLDPRTHKRCGSERGIEADHVIPWAYGGKTELSNARLMCRQHHSRVSFLVFGERRKWVPRS
jgi:5-methylcytosine-specific restriction endonuclease McrA